MEEEEPLQIVIPGHPPFEAKPEIYQPTGKITYKIEVEGQVVRFGGNPEIGEMLIIPYDTPADIDMHLLEDIARAIERAVF